MERREEQKREGSNQEGMPEGFRCTEVGGRLKGEREYRKWTITAKAELTTNLSGKVERENEKKARVEKEKRRERVCVSRGIDWGNWAWCNWKAATWGGGGE